MESQEASTSDDDAEEEHQVVVLYRQPPACTSECSLSIDGLPSPDEWDQGFWIRRVQEATSLQLVSQETPMQQFLYPVARGTMLGHA